MKFSINDDENQFDDKLSISNLSAYFDLWFILFIAKYLNSIFLNSLQF